MSSTSTTQRHTPGPWTISNDESPWTYGDSRIAVECGEEFGHTEILTPVRDVNGQLIAYLPWEPLAGEQLQEELRATGRLIAAAPELAEFIAEYAGVSCECDDLPNACGPCRARALLARIDGGA